MPKDNTDSYVTRAQKSLLIVPGNRVVFSRAEGVYLFDESGKRYLDATARSGVVSFGHKNPLMAETDARMSELGTQFFQTIGDHWRVTITVNGNSYDISPGDLAEKLVKITFGKDAMVIPKETGATAINSVIKLLAPLRLKRRFFGSFFGGYHGRSGYADALTDTKPLHKSWYPASLPIRNIPFIESEEDLEQARETILRIGFENINTVLFEGVQGEGGMRNQNQELLKKLLQEIQANGGYVLADEIFTGFYRTGERFAYEHFGVTPDMVAMAKALGQGSPASAVIIRRKVFEEAGVNPADACPKAWEGGTFTWTPHAVARAIVALHYYDIPGTGEHVRAMGKYFDEKMRPAVGKYPILSLTGIGLMRGIRFGGKKNPLWKLRDETRRELIKNGIAISGVGNDLINPTLRFTPPLTIERGHIDEFCEAFGPSIAVALSTVGES